MTQFDSIENLLDPTENEENEMVETDGGEESGEETEEATEEGEEA